MSLKAEISVPAALALGVAVYGIYQVNLPSVTEVRAADLDNKDVAGAERAATWEAAGLVSVLSLIAKDPTLFLVGGAITIALSWKYRHANAVHPMTGSAVRRVTSPGIVVAQMPDASAQTSTGAVSGSAKPAGAMYDAVI